MEELGALAHLEAVSGTAACSGGLQASRVGPGGAAPARGGEISPDGEWIAFWANGELRKVPLAGGPSVRIVDAGIMFGASWGDDDRIVFARITGGLLEVPA